MRLRQVSQRAAPGRDAVGPVALLGQQRRPLPVIHRCRPASRRASWLCGGGEENPGSAAAETRFIFTAPPRRLRRQRSPVSQLGSFDIHMTRREQRRRKRNNDNIGHVLAKWVTCVMGGAVDQWGSSVGMGRVLWEPLDTRGRVPILNPLLGVGTFSKVFYSLLCLFSTHLSVRLTAVFWGAVFIDIDE